jgi:hypothetical protein
MEAACVLLRILENRVLRRIFEPKKKKKKKKKKWMKFV